MELIKTTRENGSCRVAISSAAPSMTEQKHRKACNINTIMAKARRGQAVPIAQGEPRYGDFSNVGDFHSARNAVIEAQDMFMELPAAVRRRFENDPAELIGFLEDPANLNEAIELGLVERPAEPVVSAPLGGQTEEVPTTAQEPSS